MGASPGPRAFSQTSKLTFVNCRKRNAAAEPVAPAPTTKTRCMAEDTGRGQARKAERKSVLKVSGGDAYVVVD